MSEPEQRTISITVRMDDKHDVRAVRLLLKRLLRAYDLRCVGLATVNDETKCKTMFGATAGEGNQRKSNHERTDSQTSQQTDSQTSGIRTATAEDGRTA